MAMRSPVLNVMANAALKAARGLIRDFGEVEQLQVSIKGPGDFVSTADLRAERTLRGMFALIAGGADFQAGLEAAATQQTETGLSPVISPRGLIDGRPAVLDALVSARP